MVEEKFKRKIRGGVERKTRCGEGKRRGREGVTRIEEDGVARRETERKRRGGWQEEGGKGESSDRREGVSEDYEEV